jgi:hypothetical protein
MAMSEFSKKLLLYELSMNGFPNAEYTPSSDRINIWPQRAGMPEVNGAGEIFFKSGHDTFVENMLKPLVDKVHESAAAWESSRDMPFGDLSQFRSLAEYNGVVLAARDDTEAGRGLHFAVWRYDNGRTGLEHGYYTEDYAAAKENFAARSGLISELKLFTPEQVMDITESLEYRVDHDMDIIYTKEDELHYITARLRHAYGQFDPRTKMLPEQETELAQGQARENQHGDEPGQRSEEIAADEIDVDDIDIDDSVKARLLDELRERVNGNYNDFLDSLENLSNTEVISMADKIAATRDAHSYFTSYNNFSVAELNFYLNFKNPLEVLADGWAARKSDISDIWFVMSRQHSGRAALEQYPLIADPEPPRDTALRRYMNVDLELYLGKISEKVIVHYPNDWKYDAESLDKIADSGDSESKRQVWHVCSYGTHLKNERDVFVKGSGAYEYMTDYHQNDPDMFGYIIEVTGREGNTVMGNIFEAGDYSEYAKHIFDTALRMDTVTLTYSDSWGVNAGQTVTVSRREYDDDRKRLMSESGNVIKVRFNPADEAELNEVLRQERSRRMALPLGSARELLGKVHDRLSEVRKPPEQPAVDTADVGAAEKKAPILSRIKEAKKTADAHNERSGQTVKKKTDKQHE